LIAARPPAAAAPVRNCVGSVQNTPSVAHSTKAEQHSRISPVTGVGAKALAARKTPPIRPEKAV
jgi:hypothetical protein